MSSVVRYVSRAEGAEALPHAVIVNEASLTFVVDVIVNICFVRDDGT